MLPNRLEEEVWNVFNSLEKKCEFLLAAVQTVQDSQERKSLPERLATWRGELAKEINLHERDIQAASILYDRMTQLVEKIFSGQH